MLRDTLGHGMLRGMSAIGPSVNTLLNGGGYRLEAFSGSRNTSLVSPVDSQLGFGPSMLRAHRRLHGARRSRCFILAQRRRGAERREKGEVSSIQYPVSSIQCLMGDTGIGLGGNATFASRMEV